MSLPRVTFCVIAMFLAGSIHGRATIIDQHQLNTDPLTESFASGIFGGSSTTNPVTNDLGLDAWSISNSAQSAQFAYFTGSLTPTEKSAIVSAGFTLTAIARVVKQAAPDYTPGTPVVIATTGYDDGLKRYNMYLGLDANGDTVVVLPSSINLGGPGGSLQAPGASYTLTGLGNGYHTYQLVGSPATLVSSLYVDGTLVLSGYGGHTSFVSDSGLAFGAVSGGQGLFNLVSLESGIAIIPEPSAGALIGFGALVLRARGVRRGRAEKQAQAPTV